MKTKKVVVGRVEFKKTNSPPVFVRLGDVDERPGVRPSFSLKTEAEALQNRLEREEFLQLPTLDPQALPDKAVENGITTVSSASVERVQYGMAEMEES